MIFKTINSSINIVGKTLALFNKDWNTYKTNWEHGFSQNVFTDGIKSFFQSSNSNSIISKDQVQILRNWNNAVAHGCNNQETFNKIIANADEKTKMYFAGLNKGKGSFEGLKNAQNIVKTSTIGLTIAQTALNMAISLGLMAAISLALEGFDKLVNSSKRASEATDEAFSNTNQKVKQNEHEAKSLDELISKYKELKENDNLDVDSRKEVKELQNDIADLVGTQAKNLDLVNGKLDDEIKKLDEITAKEAKNAYETATANYNNAYNATEKATGDDSLLFVDGYAYTGKREKEAEKVLQKAGFENNVQFGGFLNNTLVVTDSFDNSMKELKGAQEKADYLQSMIDVLEQNGQTATDLYSGLIKQRDDYLKYIDDQQSAANSLVNSWITYSQFSNDKLSKINVNSVDSFVSYRQTMIEEAKNDESIRKILADGTLSDEDLENTINSFMATHLEFSTWYEQWLGNVQNSTLNIESPISKIPTISSSIQQIATQLEPQFAKLGEAYQAIFTDEGFTLDAVDNSMLEDLRQSFTEIEEQTGIAFDASLLDPFFDTLTDESSTAEQVQQAFNDLATSYLYSSDVLEQLNSETAESVKKQLEEMGVTNADELVTYALTQAKMKAALASFDFTNASGSLKDAMLQETDALGLTEEETANLANAYSNAQSYMVSALNNGANERLKKLGSELSAIRSYSDALNVLSGKYGYTDSWRYYADGYFESDQQWMRDILDYGKSLDNAQAILDTALNTQAQYTGLYSPSRNSQDSSNDAKETAETFNWLETLLSRIQRKVTNFGKTVSAVWQNWTTRGNAAVQQLAAIREELTAQQQAYDAYLAKADSVGLSGYYQDLVKNGSIHIEDITDDGLKEQIKAFQEWYEKALAASDSIDDLKDNLAELAKTRFDSVSKQFEEQLSLIEHESDLINSRLEQTEAKGYLVSGDYYSSLIILEENNLAQLRQEHDALRISLAEALADGSIEQYSESWYDMAGSIREVEKTIEEAGSSLIEYKNRLRELDWDLFDRSQEQMAQIPKESDFLLSLMEDSGLYDESGSFNRLGNAAAGLHAVNLNTYMAQADDYAREIARISRELAEDPYNTILLDRRQELLNSQQDMISSAKDERQAIKDLVSDGYSRMLDFLSDIIDKRREALQAEKDLYDYQKSIAEQTKAVSIYEKQLAAFSGDDSEETKNTIQQIRVSLEEAKQGLEDTEYDKWLSDQEQLLDRLQDDTEEWVNARLDDIDGLITAVIDSTNENAGEIKETLDGLGEKVGYSLSTSMDEIWSKDGGVGQVVSQYSQDFRSHATTVQNVLSGIHRLLQQMAAASGQQAQADLAGIHQGGVALTAPPASTGASGGTAAGSPSGSSSSGSDSSSSWGSWFVQKKDSYPKSKLNTETSIVDRLKSLDLDSSFSQRKRYYSAMGGSGTYTGSASQNTWMLEQMKLHGYAEGSSGIPEDRLAWTQEKGDELIYRASDGAMLTPLGKGDMVFTSEMTKRLWDLSKLPSVRPSLPPMPTLQDVYLPVPEDVSSRGTGDVILQFDGIQISGVNDVDQFTDKLATALASDRRIGKILVDKTIGLALGKNSLLARSR